MTGPQRPAIKFPRGGGLILLVLALLGLWLFSMAYTPIRFGTVGVLTEFGAVTGTVFQPGLNWKVPFIQDVKVYRTQKITYEASDEPGASRADYIDFPVDTTTADGQQISIRYTVRFRIDGGQAAWVAQNLGTEPEVVEKITKTDSRIHVRNLARNFAAIDLYTGNVYEFQDQVSDRLRPLFEQNGLLLDEFGVRAITFRDDYVTAIEQKQIEAERIATEQNRASQEEFRKQAAITRAEGEAQSIRVRGDALRAFPEVLQLETINKIVPNIRVMLLPAGQSFILGQDVLGALEAGQASSAEPAPSPTPTPTP